MLDKTICPMNGFLSLGLLAKNIMARTATQIVAHEATREETAPPHNNEVSEHPYSNIIG